MEQKERKVLNALFDLFEWSVKEEVESRLGDSEYSQGRESIFDDVAYQLKMMFYQSQDYDVVMALKGLVYDKTKELDLNKEEIANYEMEIKKAREEHSEDYDIDGAKDNINYRQGCVDALTKVIYYVDRKITDLMKG